jgi:AraC family transcriptional regulator
MSPELTQLPRLHLIGVSTYGTSAEGLFGQTWERLSLLQDRIRNCPNPQVAYGVNLYPPEFTDARKWNYLAAVQVSTLEDIPLSAFAVTLPPSLYAIFTVRGGLEEVPAVYRRAYNEWLPQSDYQLSHPFDFERYDERFHPDHPQDSLMEFCLPVRPKA